MTNPLTLPVPVIFAVCQGVQQLANGAFNLLGIYDRITVYQLPDGTTPDTVTLQVATVWTGGNGRFEQVLRLLNQDGEQVVESRSSFTLAGTSARHVIVAMIAAPAREGVYTFTVGRGEEELLRQDFTIEVVPFPGTQQ